MTIYDANNMIEGLAANPYLGKPLQDELLGYRSLRFKRYRVIYQFQENKNALEIIFAGMRKDVYQNFTEALRRLKQRT